MRASGSTRYRASWLVRRGRGQQWKLACERASVTSTLRLIRRCRAGPHRRPSPSRQATGSQPSKPSTGRGHRHQARADCRRHRHRVGIHAPLGQPFEAGRTTAPPGRRTATRHPLMLAVPEAAPRPNGRRYVTGERQLKQGARSAGRDGDREHAVPVNLPGGESRMGAPCRDMAGGGCHAVATVLRS